MKIKTPDEYRKSIREKPENELKENIIARLEKSNKTLIEGSFDFFIDFIKVNFIYVNCMRHATVEEARVFLEKMLNCFNIKNLNIAETLEQIKVDSIYKPKRLSEWTFSERNVITDNQEKITLKCYSTEVKKINNWKEEGYGLYNYDIICHENQILWHTTDPDIHSEPDYYIMKNKKIYGLSFHNCLWVNDKLDIIYNDICVNIDTLDEIMDNFGTDEKFEEWEDVGLEDCLEKDFFSKGQIIDREWERPKLDMNVIGFVGNYVKIEITNLTYPQTGCILLDIENKEIIEEKKYQSRKITTEEEAIDAIKPENGFSLSFIPLELRTAKVCLETVKKNPETLLFMPAEHRTEEMCLEAVKAHGKALEYVPDELKTPEVCRNAIKQDGWALTYVPAKLKTPEFCLEAVKTGDGALYCVPDELKTAEFCLEAIELDAWSLNFVPYELRTVEICLEAMKREARIITEVPEELREEVLHKLTGGKYLLVQKKEHAKMSFEKEALSIEFTEIIGDMDMTINYDQKKRDEFLQKYGKKLLKKIPLRKIKERNKYIEFRHETRILSQKEIDELLTATISLTPLKKVIDDLKWKLKWKIKKLREWKLIIKNIRKNIEYKFSLNGIERVDLNIIVKSLIERSDIKPMFTQEEVDAILKEINGEEDKPVTHKKEVLSKEEMDELLSPIKEEDKKSK